MSEKICRRCGSTKIIPHVQMIDQGHYSDGYLRTGFKTKPEALIMKGWVQTEVWADICGACGALELSVDNPAELYTAYRQRLAHKKDQG